MKILLCHCYYTQRGGEDRSFEEERELLIAAGHHVVEYVRDNNELNTLSGSRAALTTLWNRRAAAEVAVLVERERPEVVHCTNTFPLMSPAVCHAAHRRGAAVVYALRNYRLLCASPYLMRDNRPCEDCIGRAIPWPAVVHRCYRDSAAASAAIAAMQVLHRALGTWRRKVDAFLTLTDFARQKFVQAGFDADRLHVKNNSVQPDPGVGNGSGGYVAFAARLSPEKGLSTLLGAWRQDPTLPPLKIVGDGPLAAEAQAAACNNARIEYCGRRPESEVHRIFANATAVVVPSLWYETFGRTVAEAFAGGTPVIASRLGALAELVDDGRTGWLFTPGDASDLAVVVRAAVQLPAPEHTAFRARARAEYLQRFTPQRNYARLMEIYDLALQHAALRRGGRTSVAASPVETRTTRDAHLSGVVA